MHMYPAHSTQKSLNKIQCNLLPFPGICVDDSIHFET